MKSVVRWATQNSPAMNTLMITVMLVGAASMAMMRREVFPEFELEIILVTVPYPGATPSEVEEGICQKIEEAVRSISGIKKQTAVAQEGSGYLVLELKSEVKDVQKILNEVRAEIDRIPSFPELAEDPEVTQITFRSPAIRVGVVGPDDTSPEAELALRELAEEIRDDLLQLESVSQANLINAKSYQIDVEIAEETLRKHGLSLREVAQIIRRENIEMPGGKIQTKSQDVLLRGKNKRLRGEEIAKIPVLSQSSGAVLTVGDLGTVRDAFDDTVALNRISVLADEDRRGQPDDVATSRPGMVISIDRTSNEDLLAMVEQVKAYVAEQNPKMPAGYSLHTWRDTSIDVRDRMDLLLRNGLQGLLLVFLVLAVFLEFRLAFWVALGIPIAVLGAGAVLMLTGQTLNMLSMFAFLLALGIVVDDAIVIGENIYAHRQLGESSVKAAINGTYEVLPSVAASVSTTIIAFTPLLFVSGIMGKFIAVMPVAVIAMLVISLVESTLILPCHLSHESNAFFKILGIILYPLRAVIIFFHWVNYKSNEILQFLIEKTYVPTMNRALAFPMVAVSCGLALLIFSLGFITSGITPFVIFPKLDSNVIESKIAFADGTPAEVTDEATRRIEAAFLRVHQRHAAKGQPIGLLTHRAVGEISGAGALGPDSRTGGGHVGAVYVELVETGDRSMTSEQILREWREEAGEFYGVERLTFGTPNFGPGGAAIEFKLLAPPEDFESLEQAVEECKQKLATYNGVQDIRDDSAPGKWEYQLRIKDRAIARDVKAADLAETVRAAYYGDEVMRLQRGRHEVKLMVRYPREQRRSLADFEKIRVRAGDGAEMPLTEVADVTIQRSYSEINRIEQMRSITITADVSEIEGPDGKVPNAREIVADFQRTFLNARSTGAESPSAAPGAGAAKGDEQTLANATFRERYPEVRIRWEGQKEQSVESINSLLKGFAVAIFAMYCLLTVEFRSYLQPLLILAIIPFGFIGAIWGHALLGIPVTLFSLFGMVALTGVVVNDSIVLIDFINHRINDGLPLNEALLEAGRRRFRPVLLTSFTTIAGLTPILLEKSFQAQVLIPMAASLSFGLAVATAMVLVLVPTLYSIYARFAAMFVEDDPTDDDQIGDAGKTGDVVEPASLQS